MLWRKTKMEHIIHLIKERATKAKAKQMVIKEIPRRKITAIACCYEYDDDMCWSTTSIRCKKI